LRRFTGLILGVTLLLTVVIGSVVAKRKDIAVLPPGTTSPFHSQIAKGAQLQGESMNFRVEVQAPESESDFLGQVSVMEKFIMKQVDAISVNAIDDKKIIRAIRHANEAKIPVFVHNSQTPIQGEAVVEYIGYNQRNGGKACGSYSGKLLRGNGEVFIIEGIHGFHQIERTGGFLDGIKHFPGIRVVGRQTADWEREKAMDVATQALIKYPGIALFFANSDEMAIGAAMAARKLGKKVFTVGIDGNPVTLDKIAEGDVTATLGVYPDKMGAQIVLQMNKFFHGEKIPPYLETPAVVVDKSNLEDYKAGKLWTEPKPGAAEELLQKIETQKGGSK
jgi:ABC-type sugar transport system substrate-binding protein